MDLKTWKFYLIRAERYWFEYKNYLENLQENHAEYFNNNQLSEEQNEVHDMYQEITVFIEQVIADAEVEENEQFNNHEQFDEFDLNRTMFELSQNIRHMKKDSHDDFKLPRITLPKFDGSFSKWPEFRDLFVSLIHNRKTIPKVQKLQYLKGNLEKEAADIIRHLQITDANYDSAWQLIEKRFNNKKMLITHYLNQLLNQESIRSEHAGLLN